MRFGFAGGIILVLVLVLAILGYGSLLTVHQTKQALVVRLGNPVRHGTYPGLHLKSPLIDSVIYIDKRILDLESPPQEVIASDQKRLVVDAFARYRIEDPLKFYQTVGSIEGARSRLSTLLVSALRRVLGEATFIQLVRDERPQLYQRMQTERQRIAAEARAQGSQRSQEIRSKADRDVTVLIAEAQSKAEQTRGEGDAKRNQIFAEAYSRDPGFFAFYRSMQAYETGLRSNDTRMLLRPDSDFFRYFVDPAGKPRDGAAPAGRPAAPSTAPPAGLPAR